ncbi:MAG: class I SAM-dependent methyltransferase [Methylococcales bacterium]
MAKNGEIDYLKNLGEEGINHALNKPFSDTDCGNILIQIGTVIGLLPPAPQNLLDLGCGTGWTSCFFAKCGYDVTGIDIAPDMIDCAKKNKERESLHNVQFEVLDYEEAAFENQFDCAVFFDSLHHAVDEKLAIQTVYKALKPSGICIAVEPGEHHATQLASVEAMEKFNVTEKDMPPYRIIALAEEIGFREFKVLPPPERINRILFNSLNNGEFMNFGRDILNWSYAVLGSIINRKKNGIVWMRKPSL